MKKKPPLFSHHLWQLLMSSTLNFCAATLQKVSITTKQRKVITVLSKLLFVTTVKKWYLMP